MGLIAWTLKIAAQARKMHVCNLRHRLPINLPIPSLHGEALNGKCPYPTIPAYSQNIH